MATLMRFYRRRAGLSQEQLAEKSGVSLNVIKFVETRRTKNMAAENIDRLVPAMKLSRAEHVGLVEIATKPPRVDLSDRVAALEDRFARIEEQIAELLRRRRGGP